VHLNGITGSKKGSEIRNANNQGWKPLTEFYDAKGIVHHKFELENQNVNGNIYKVVIKRLIAPVHCIRSKSEESRSWHFLHDKARAHDEQSASGPGHYPLSLLKPLDRSRGGPQSQFGWYSNVKILKWKYISTTTWRTKHR
jgi:hypothetical protein